MLSPLAGLMKDEGSSIYYSKSFREELEKHLDILRTGLEANGLAIEPNIAIKYKGDFYGLLTYYNIPYKYHWITMRVNKYTSTMDYEGTVDTIIIPDFKLIDQLRATHTTIEVGV